MTPMTVLARIAWLWGCRCFGQEHMTDPAVRAIRLAEEAIELAQAVDVPQEQMHQLVDMVYAKAPGDVMQELGGIAVTLSVMCRLLGAEVEAVMEREVQRCLEKTPEHFRARNEHKIKLGMTGAAAKAYEAPAS